MARGGQDINPEAAAKRLTLIEAALGPLSEASSLHKGQLVEAARDLIDKPLDAEVRIGLLGGPPADPREQARLRTALEARAAELREALGRDPVKPADLVEEVAERVDQAAKRSPRENHSNDTTSSAGPPMLATGATGEQVGQAQSRLAELGYSTPTDGTFGANTEAAVRDFQRHHDLKMDGQIGPKTTVAMRGTNSAHVAEVAKAKAAKSARMKAARTRRKANADKKAAQAEAEKKGNPYKAEAETPAEDKGEVKQGDKGGEVKEVQEALLAHGTFIGDAGVDGTFGLETKLGVKRVQRRSGLTPDGVVGPATREVLQEAPIGLPRITKPAAAAPKQRGGQGTVRGMKGITGEFNPALHPRGAKGTPVGGQFITANSTGKLAKAVRKKLGIKGGDFTQKVKQYQRQNGLQVDGVVGAQTAAALAGSTTTTKPGALDQTAHNSLQSLTKNPTSSTTSSTSTKATAAKTSSTPAAKTSTPASTPTSTPASSTTPAKTPSSTTSGSSSGTSASSTSSSSSTSGLLRRGATGTTVAAVAKALGVKNATTYSPALKKAVEQYQRNHGLQVDGIIGQQTAASMLGRKAHAPGKMGQNLESALANLTKHKLHEAKATPESCGMPHKAMAEKGKRKCPGCGTDLTKLQEAWIDQAADDLLETVAQIVDEAGEKALLPFILWSPNQLREAVDSMAKATTPEPFSTSTTSNWVARVGGLPPYIQHVAHDLMEKGKMTESRAIGMAVGIIKNWAHGHNGKGGTVHPDTVAAAQLALREWQAKKAKSHTLHEAMTKAEKDDVGDQTTEQALKCPECGNEQSAKLANCKKCGHDMAATRKRKFGSMQESTILGFGHYMGRLSGNLFRRLPGGKWQSRGRDGRWIDMPNPPNEKLLTAKGFGATETSINTRDVARRSVAAEERANRTRPHGVGGSGAVLTMGEARRTDCRKAHLIGPEALAEAKNQPRGVLTRCQNCGKRLRVRA